VRLVVIQPVAESATAGVRGTKMKERKERRKQKKKRGYSVFYIYHITAPTPSVNNQFSESRYVAINTCGIVNHGSTLGGNGTVTTGCLPLHKPDLQGAKQRLPSDGSHVHSFGVIRTPRNENRKHNRLSSRFESTFERPAGNNCRRINNNKNRSVGTIIDIRFTLD